MPKEIEAKSILNKTKRRDPWFLDDYTVNPYSGCSFNCLYCYIRGSKYGMNMEHTLSVKVNADQLLEKQLALRAKKEQYGIIVLSSVTDPYIGIEKDYEMTRKMLQIILKYRFPVHIITKSDMITRDYDLLQVINENAILPVDLRSGLTGGTIISFSFSTLEDMEAKIFEPGATPPSKRLLAMSETVKRGFRTGVSLMPLLPYISDTSERLDEFYRTFKNHNVNYILPASITLFGSNKADSKTLMMNAIAKHYPHLKTEYQKLFDNAYQVPFSYKKSLEKKAKLLNDRYDIPNHITDV